MRHEWSLLTALALCGLVLAGHLAVHPDVVLPLLAGVLDRFAAAGVDRERALITGFGAGG